MAFIISETANQVNQSQSFPVLYFPMFQQKKKRIFFLSFFVVFFRVFVFCQTIEEFSNELNFCNFENVADKIVDRVSDATCKFDSAHAT